MDSTEKVFNKAIKPLSMFPGQEITKDSAISALRKLPTDERILFPDGFKIWEELGWVKWVDENKTKFVLLNQKGCATLTKNQVAAGIEKTIQEVDSLISRHFSPAQNCSLSVSQRISLLTSVLLEHTESELMAAWAFEESGG